MRITVEDILRNVEVKVEGDQLKLSGQLNLSVQMSAEGENVPDELEEDVEQTGQELKRLIYRMLVERADQEEVLRMRDGKEGQGIQQRGTRPLSFHTRFGLVSVERKRVMHRADGSTEVPSAKAWKAPQHDYMTRGLRHAVCDELQDRTVRRACQGFGERAGQADFLNDATALDILHREGARLIAAQRDRAEAILKKNSTIRDRLVPPKAKDSAHPCHEGTAETLVEDPQEAAEASQIAVGFLDPDSPESREVPGTEREPSVFVPPDRRRRVDPHWVLAELDEVKVKAQAIWDGKEIWLYTATVLVEEKTYYFAEATKDTLFDQLAALLSLLGVLDGKRQVLALADGALWIRSWFEFLRLPGKQMILCWYHLAKRCYQRLSAGGFPKARRQELEQELLNHLWTGNVDGALSVLDRVRDEARHPEWIDDMGEYLKKRRGYIPDYQARHKAGLWIASNRVEKWNDWSVSDRCKRRGMSWVVRGVHSLAAHQAARRNGELSTWRASGELPAWTVPAKQAA